MATAKSLQVPKIIEVIGATIRVAHPDISGNIRTYLNSTIAAGGTTMSVYDNAGFEDNDWFVIGELGDEQTEDNDVHGAVTRGSSITVTNAQSFAHELNAPVTRIYERGIKIYGTNTAANSGGTLIASIEAKTASGRQLADAVMIQWNKPYTEYTLITTDTAYSYYYAVFTDGTTSSSSSEYVAATGLASNTVETFIQDALLLTDTKLGNKISREDCVKWCQRCQDTVQQFTYQDPQSGRFIQKDWSFEEFVEETSIALTENENKYALSGLTADLKYPDADRSILQAWIGIKKPLVKMTIQEYQRSQEGIARATTAAQTTAGDTTITVGASQTYDFTSSGSVVIGDDTITYTGVSGGNSFTGVPASGTGAITETNASGTPVWQGVTPGLPRAYAIFDGYIYLNVPADDAYEGMYLKIRGLKKLTRITKASDTTDIPFTNVFSTYLAAMIEAKNGNLDKSQKWMVDFKEEVKNNALADRVAVADPYRYYNYHDEMVDVNPSDLEDSDDVIIY